MVGDVRDTAAVEACLLLHEIGAVVHFAGLIITRYGMTPSKVAWLAHQAWKDASRGDWPAGTPEDEKVAYDLGTIKTWLRKFLVRFFQASQFKRSAVPNGPKVVTGGSLSPRGDWRAPSDATARVWLDELEANVPD